MPTPINVNLVSNTNTRPKPITVGTTVTPQDAQKISEGDGGYEFTGAFSDRIAGTTGANSLGTDVSYSQQMVDDEQWLRFGFDPSAQINNDSPYWASPTPADAKGVGLFGGAYLPAGVSSLFDFGYELNIKDVGADQSPQGTTYPQVAYDSKSGGSLKILLGRDANNQTNGDGDPILRDLMVSANPVVGEEFHMYFYEPSSTEVPSTGEKANLQNIWKGEVVSFSYDASSYYLQLSSPDLTTSGSSGHRTAQNNNSLLNIYEMQALCWGQPAPAPTDITYDMMDANGWQGNADFYLEYDASPNSYVDIYYTIDQAAPPTGYSALKDKVWQDGDTIQFDISATSWDTNDPGGVFTITLTYTDAVFGSGNPAGSNWDIEDGYLSIYLADIGATYAGQSVFTVEPAAGQVFDGSYWYVVGNGGQPDITQLDVTLQQPNPLDYSTTFSAEVTGGSLNYTAAPGSFDFTDCSAGDYLQCRFDFNLTPQIQNTTVEVALIWQTRDENGNPTFTFPLTTQPLFFGTGTVGKTYLCRPIITAYFASDEDVNARALLAVRADNPFLIAPLTTLPNIIR